MPVTYTPIATNTLTSTASTVTFSSIPSTYTDLVLVTSVLDSSGFYLLRYNSDSGTNYSRIYLNGTGSAALSSFSANDTSHYGLAGGSTYQPTITNIMNYSNTSVFKTSIQRANDSANVVQTSAFLWRSTSAISSVNILSSGGGSTFLAGSTFTLYGIKAA